MVKVGSSTSQKTNSGRLDWRLPRWPSPTITAEKDELSCLPKKHHVQDAMAEDLQNKLMESGSMGVLKDDHLDKSGGI